MILENPMQIGSLPDFEAFQICLIPVIRNGSKLTIAKADGPNSPREFWMNPSQEPRETALIASHRGFHPFAPRGWGKFQVIPRK